MKKLGSNKIHHGENENYPGKKYKNIKPDIKINTRGAWHTHN